ncbi:KH homology domain-containing protein 4 isoform X2 [Kryptolebias marmoratus]|uniref:KH homology domain-containing protein 4 isoform X2 n=1 Tax=Kryptolebias marmoratus TaxID=37003 RepID=UPI000D52F378|nr:KH homology domain-containing protein 4 isoform X2 [Kryptolebias marmoratus]
MSSGMTGQTRCLTSRWDKPAQPKDGVDVQQQNSVGNAARPVSLPGVVGSSGSNSTVPRPPKTEEKPTQGGVEMAAAMAAKINAMLMAKGKLLTPPPLPAKMPTSVPVPAATEEVVVTEVDINDVPLNSRDLLTKGKTQEEIRQFSGAVVSTKGHYMTDVEKGKVGGQRPLYLHVQGKTQEQVNKAVLRIKEIISEDVMRASAASGGQQVPVIPPLTLYPQPPRPAVPPPVPRMPSTNSVPGPGHRPAAPHTGSFVHTKIFVGLDQAPPSFNVKEKVEGPSGTYLTHIQTETGARIFLRGKGSGYIEQASKRESFEPLYIYISHPNAAGLESAKKLTESLLETVRAEYARTVSVYTASGSTQPYSAHGYPSNSSYSSQASWYNYPANGYAVGYAAYPGAAAYWSNAEGPPSTVTPNPPSSQTMVQYPVCPRKPHPYLVQDPGSSETVEPEGCLNTSPDTGSPKHGVQEEAENEPLGSCSPEDPAQLESSLPSSSAGEEKVERVLMPPPPPPFVAPAPVTRKRPMDAAAEDPASLRSAAASLDVEEDVCVKKIKVNLDTSGLVPYGGDSSDEEDERTHSSFKRKRRESEGRVSLRCNCRV